ncbi:MAG: glutamate--cysteine ligase [Betaproteobacteria bacterium]|nr:glutamate--cysteine ligase [Betaproteobacteria bacterium]MDH3437534.1 glutamate--cysteine ligase [Betaproteobacteria bacterium]
MSVIEKRLAALTPEMLKGLRRGIEKESLRVRPDGALADTPHPARLGSPLTHPHITTDFSEAQLELITGVHTDADACVEELTEIHQFVYRNIGEEMLWCSSMPCKLPADDAIPIGQYGRSNIGTAKTVYRIGLSHRYGRRMQTISGVHYNFSLPEAAWPLLQKADGRGGSAREYQDAAYFSLIRNFRRHSWLLFYLFGASPAVCETFVAGRKHGLKPLAGGTLYLPGATSLRMGPLGYQSEAQAALSVSYNSLESYARSLYRALTEPYPRYAAIGIRDGDNYRQLDTTLLQIENEFYGTIRAKRPVRPGERPLHALGERGVEYIEVRCLDLDPFCFVGITAATMRFLDVFLLHCALSESLADTPGEIATNNRNHHQVAEHGRDADVQLVCRAEKLSLSEWGGQLLGECEPIAEALDAARNGSAYRDAVATAGAALRNPSWTPSARVLHEISQRHQNSYLQFVLGYSKQYRADLVKLPFPAEVEARFKRAAEDSLVEQRKTEAGDAVPFDTFRQQYLSQDLLGGLRL